MIWDTLIWRLECSNRSKIRSAQKCNPCLRYELSPMSPGRTEILWSGRPDLNRGPPAPKAGAIPGFATPRHEMHTHCKALSDLLVLLFMLFGPRPGAYRALNESVFH